VSDGGDHPQGITENFEYGFTANTGSLEFGFGQTMVDSTGVGGNLAYVARLDGDRIAAQAASTAILLAVDLADSGKLKVYLTGAPNCVGTFWIDFTAPFDNVA